MIVTVALCKPELTPSSVRSISKNLKYMKLISLYSLIYPSVEQHNRTDRKHVDLLSFVCIRKLGQFVV